MYIYQHIEDNTKYYIDSNKNISQIFIQHRYRVNKIIKSSPLLIIILKNTCDTLRLNYSLFTGILILFKSFF